MPAAREFSIEVDGGCVSALWLRPRHAVAVLTLAHGAGAGMRHPFLEALATALAGERIATLRYQFPYMEAGRRYPDRAPALHATVRAAVAEGRRRTRGVPLFAGGKSMGGRMTSEADALETLPGIAGIVFFGFPLHPPRKPGTARARHLAATRPPLLFLQGDRDALAGLDLLRPELTHLGGRATLHVVTGADHGFAVLKRSGRSGAEILTELAVTTRRWVELAVDRPGVERTAVPGPGET